MSANLDPIAALRRDAELIDRAVEDAKRFGAGWLMVDRNGILRCVDPVKVITVGARPSDKDR
ncbi:hypothetical protein [Tropicimonas sediminicola]|uniref:Uncharacterized protein n=1 Tax=Tropicimonas sediminicola TaxID=1031541 RepID=A0A239DEP7_9RHOB|nr:hypothetical protein [Tropicimonas sediminicola]SNS30966.1 hypothetical protein SAMN05421757_101795 [Tropicimonas sediminicola]